MLAVTHNFRLARDGGLRSVRIGFPAESSWGHPRRAASLGGSVDGYTRHFKTRKGIGRYIELIPSGDSNLICLRCDWIYPRSAWEPNAKKKITKTSKSGNRNESRIGLKKNQERLTLLVSLIEPFEGLLVLPKRG